MHWLQGRIQDLKKGGAEGTGAKRQGKFRDATPTFGQASALVGVVKHNFAFARARTIIIIAVRLETKRSAIQC